MKKVLSVILASLVALSSLAFASSNTEKKMDKKMDKKMTKEMMKKKVEKKVQPNNIDKNNVGITKHEDLDQSDPTIIEGNLEDNDFKN